MFISRQEEMWMGMRGLSLSIEMTSNFREVMILRRLGQRLWSRKAQKQPESLWWSQKARKEKLKEDVFLLLGIFIFTYYESAEELFYQYIRRANLVVLFIDAFTLAWYGKFSWPLGRGWSFGILRWSPLGGTAKFGWGPSSHGTAKGWSPGSGGHGIFRWKPLGTVLSLLAREYLQLLKMVGKFIGHCLNFPTIYTGKQ